MAEKFTGKQKKGEHEAIELKKSEFRGEERPIKKKEQK